MQNIGADNAGDAFYRYKMPKIQARIEGRGNGIKTNVVNNVDIAKALERPPDYLVKYFGCELGALSKYDPKSGTSIVNGAHDASKLAEILEGFIKKYVQCYSCGNPETVFKIRKDNISLKCKACGAVSNVDMTHRLNTYILKHPPEDKTSKAEKKVKKMEKERLKGLEGDEKKKSKKKDKDGKKKKDGDEDGGAEAEGSPEELEEDGEADDVVWMTDVSAEAVKRRAEEQLSAATAAMVTQGNIEAEQEEARKKAEEESRRAEEAARKKAEEEARLKAEEEARRKEEEEEVAARRKAEEEQRAAAAANEVAAADEDDEVDELVEQLRELAATHSAAKVSGALKKLDVAGGTVVRMKLLYLALFGNAGSTKLSQLVKQHSQLLKLHAGDGAGQLAQLVALEYLLGVALPDKRKETTAVLKTLYDLDITEEEPILHWYSKTEAGKKLGLCSKDAAAVRAAAKPFVEWLENASDDEEE